MAFSVGYITVLPTQKSIAFLSKMLSNGGTINISLDYPRSIILGI
jgi:hypothetical protein